MSPTLVAPWLTASELGRVSHHLQRDSRAMVNSPSHPHARRHHSQRNLPGAISSFDPSAVSSSTLDFPFPQSVIWRSSSDPVPLSPHWLADLTLLCYTRILLELGTNHAEPLVSPGTFKSSRCTSSFGDTPDQSLLSNKMSVTVNVANDVPA